MGIIVEVDGAATFVITWLQDYGRLRILVSFSDLIIWIDCISTVLRLVRRINFWVLVYY